MAWGTVPTAKGKISYAKGRLKRFAKVEEWEEEGRKGIKATFPNGSKVVVLPSRDYSGDVRYFTTHLDRDTGDFTTTTKWSLREAAQLALGGHYEFDYLNGRVSITIGLTRLGLSPFVQVGLNVNNPEVEWYWDKNRSLTVIVDDEDVVRDCVGLMAQNLPLLVLERVCECRPEMLKYVEWAELNPVPDSKIKKVEWNYERKKNGLPGYRTVYLTDDPVEGAEGEWRETYFLEMK